jgi:hypothetical protein
VNVARRYALAARNWTAASYQAAWEQQIALAGGRFRRALVTQRPGRRQLSALRRERASSTARVLRTARSARAQGPIVDVLVTLQETTRAGGQIVRGVTLNEARLRRRGKRWLVVGWTVIPGGVNRGRTMP